METLEILWFESSSALEITSVHSSLAVGSLASLIRDLCEAFDLNFHNFLADIEFGFHSS